MRLWWKLIFRRGRLERDLDRELDDHLSRRVEELVQLGESPEQARAKARREFGNPARIKEDIRETWIARWVHDLALDAAFGARTLGRNPLLAMVAILTLAFGIGVNTAVFSVLNGWLYRPLPLREPSQIVVLAPIAQSHSDQFSFPNFSDLRQQSGDTFSDLFAFGFHIAGLSADGNARQFVMGAVSGNYFSGLGVGAALGRVFVSGEGEKPGDELSVVLAYSYWKKYFGGDPGVAGMRVTINGQAGRIVGVAAESFKGTLFSLPMDGYVTLTALAQEAGSSTFWTDRGSPKLNILGRMKPGVSLQQAQASMDVAARRLSEEYPETNRAVGIRVIPEPYARPVPLVANFVPVIAGLFLFLPGLVLVLACMNVAGMLMARAEARNREMAIRASLGGGRGRLVRQLLTETMLLASLGSVAGVALGISALRAIGAVFSKLATSASSDYGLSMDTSFDWRVFAYALLATLATGLIVGLWPAIRASRSDVNTLLHGGGRGASGSRAPRRLRNSLVVTQIAVSLMLLIVSALFVRSLKQAEQANLGFDPHNVLMVMTDPIQIGYDESRTNELYREMKAGLRAVPGVQSVSMSFTVPMTFLSMAGTVWMETHPLQAGQTAPSVAYNIIDEAHLSTMRIALAAGRGFTEADGKSAPMVAIVNRTMAQRFWPGEDPIGKRFSLRGASGPFLEIVGMTEDGQYRFFSPEPQAYFYVPLSQNYSSARSLEIRSTVPPESLIPAIEAEVHKLSRDLPIINIATMEQVAHGFAGLLLPEVAAELSGLLGLVGLGLAVIGIYGVVAFGVQQRARELAIRMALGARPGDVLRLVAGQGLRLVLVGIAVGLAAALLAGRGTAKLLIGVSSTDPATYATVATILGSVALLACYIPARDAARANASDALRSE